MIAEIYPPQTAENLQTIQDHITHSKSPDHHKLSVLYYVVKDLSRSKPEAEKRFLELSYLPKNYRVFIDGIWCLDRLQFDVSYLLPFEYTGQHH